MCKPNISCSPRLVLSCIYSTPHHRCVKVDSCVQIYNKEKGSLRSNNVITRVALREHAGCTICFFKLNQQLMRRKLVTTVRTPTKYR